MADLSEKYPEIVFLKVDAEICTVMIKNFSVEGQGRLVNNLHDHNTVLIFSFSKQLSCMR